MGMLDGQITIYVDGEMDFDGHYTAVPEEDNLTIDDYDGDLDDDDLYELEQMVINAMNNEEEEVSFTLEESEYEVYWNYA